MLASEEEGARQCDSIFDIVMFVYLFKIIISISNFNAFYYLAFI